MKKTFWALVVVLALAIPATALAVTLHDAHKGTSCGELTGSWHFVANQVGGLKPAGTLTATFSSGVVVQLADHITKGSQHWTVTAAGTLLNAESTVGEKLVLSDYTCDEKKDDGKK